MSGVVVRCGPKTNEVAGELGCDWHTINDTVIARSTLLLDHPNRIGVVDAMGLDEKLFARLGRWRTQAWSISIVDVRQGQLLDAIPGRPAAEVCAWLPKSDQA